MVRGISVLDGAGEGYSLAAAARELAQEERHAQQQIALIRLLESAKKKGKVNNHARFSQGLVGEPRS